MHNALLTLRLMVEHILLMQQPAAAAHATETQADAGVDVEGSSSAEGESQVRARDDREDLRGVRWQVRCPETSCFISDKILQLTKPSSGARLDNCNLNKWVVPTFGSVLQAVTALQTHCMTLRTDRPEQWKALQKLSRGMAALVPPQPPAPILKRSGSVSICSPLHLQGVCSLDKAGCFRLKHFYRAC